MSVKTLQAIVGIFFLLLGIMGILPNVDEGVFGISNRHLTLEIIFGVVELFCAVVMIFGLFAKIQREFMQKACMLVFILWIARIVFSRFIWGLPQGTASGVLNWFLILSVDAIVAASIWLLATTYKR